jgi:16S rRNA (uracil1498-N3)-methyltransferase
MSDRFFIETPVSGPTCMLAGDEARHLAAVMRAKIGDKIVVFDGSGAEFTASIAVIRKQAVELTILERRPISRELDFELTLAVALPKGDRQKWLVEKATELGVTRLVPLITTRGVAQPVETALDRLRRTVIEASKQCGRNRLLAIDPPIMANAYFQEPGNGSLRIICEATGRQMREVAFQAGSNITAAVGPEGGFTPAEVATALQTGWAPVSLGHRVLRVETAAVAIAAWAAQS